MIEFIILCAVLVGMAIAGFTLLAMLVTAGAFVLLLFLLGAVAVLFKLMPVLLVVLLLCWLWSKSRRDQRRSRDFDL